MNQWMDVEGVQVCVIVLQSHSEATWSQQVHPHLVQHGIQECTLTPSLECMSYGMLMWCHMDRGFLNVFICFVLCVI